MATKIQVRRDTTTNWTTYGAEVPAAGEFCYDTDAKTLKIGDGVTAYRDLNIIADADFDAAEISDTYVEIAGDTMTGQLTLPGGGTGAQAIQVQEAQALIDASDTGAGKYVEVSGDNMTGDLTLGTDKITLDAADGSADFASKVSTFNYDASSATASGAVVGNGIIDIQKPATATGSVFRAKRGTNDVMAIDALGTVKIGGDATLSPNILLNQNGSAEFAGGDIVLNANGTIKTKTVDNTQNTVNNFGWIFGTQSGYIQCPSNTPNDSSIFSIYRGNSKNVSLKADGSAEFAGDIDANNVSFKLEPDNDDNYTVTTEEYEEEEELTPYVPAVPATYDEYGVELTAEVPEVPATYQTVTKTREIRTYSGPTLDVKAVIQELQQRVADRDAVIADFATRLAALEADHATLMGNGNGGY